MAKLVTIVQTYFKDGTYRSNRVEMQIPDEAAKIISKYWQKKQIYNCTEAKYLASNQTATIDLSTDEDKLLYGMCDILATEQVEEEVFEHSFTSEKE